MRLSGSAPDSETHSPDVGLRRISRSSPTASGSANCSPEKPATKSAAANLPSRLKPAVDAQEIPPRRQPPGLLRQKTPEHHAITGEQRPRRILDRGVARLGAAVLRGHAIDHRPAPAALDVEAQHPPAPLCAGERLALARWHEQGAQAPEAVGGREAKRDQFAKRFLEVRPQQARGLP